MVDQVASLRKRGVKAAIVSSISASGSTISKEFLAQTVDLSSASLLFCAPEALIVSRWREETEMPSVSGVVLLQ